MICMPFCFGKEKKKEGEKRKILAPDLHPVGQMAFLFINTYEKKNPHSDQGVNSGYDLVPPYEGLFRWRGRFRLERGDPLKEGQTAQMCLDLLRLPSYARNPHISEYVAACLHVKGLRQNTKSQQDYYNHYLFMKGNGIM
ncbi:hypothetical protein M9H77_21040 [Catharanthus roseus]|uniref:Uncharacterized protein n=1 Tax=Catharanthus roseus TaxID=4058 RepID=A0ACC0AMQ1_CATRO|nr:hypothetical protein M9H77_21040 [Catharanthus roseus]